MAFKIFNMNTKLLTETEDHISSKDYGYPEALKNNGIGFSRDSNKTFKVVNRKVGAAKGQLKVIVEPFTVFRNNIHRH